ncbi:MAG: phosphate-starvation-inducible PsiE family protein [Acidobacteria bacterium]|nr:phosphate-starvation-inducible PsiE family protein [Acidobacteriota bacterium]
MEIIEPPFLMLDISKVFEGFGLALVILIGLELLKILKMFLTEDKIKPELVVEVAVIALCNKIITLDTKHTTGDILLGMTALLVGLSIGYFVLRFRAADKGIYRKSSATEESGKDL